VSRSLQAVTKVSNTELPPVDCEVGPEKSQLPRTTFYIERRHKLPHEAAKKIEIQFL
jgi:hypothetical protein